MRSRAADFIGACQRSPLIKQYAVVMTSLWRVTQEPSPHYRSRRLAIMKVTTRAIAGGLALCTGTVFADPPEVTPYRPTVSNPAALSAPGFLELEAGVARSHDDTDTRLLSVPYLLKYAFSENFGVVIGGDAYLDQKDAAGNQITGF